MLLCNGELVNETTFLHATENHVLKLVLLFLKTMRDCKKDIPIVLHVLRVKFKCLRVSLHFTDCFINYQISFMTDAPTDSAIYRDKYASINSLLGTLSLYSIIKFVNQKSNQFNSEVRQDSEGFPGT